MAIAFCGVTTLADAQTTLTIEKALDIATQNSPNLKKSFMNLERSQQNLIAQKAALKSRFSLNLNPVSYSKNRKFEDRISQWYTNESFSSQGTFQVDQPILWTDGTVSLINTFGWQNNKSITDASHSTNRAFSNDLYLKLSQPIFTYNKTKMQLKELEFDTENMLISYALQRLNTEQSITNQFYQVYISQNSLAISREELKNAEQSFEIIKNKVEADLAAKDELFQAELNLATARSAVEDKQVSLENAKDQLKQTLGIDLNEDFVTAASVDVQPVKIDLEQAIDHAMGSRLELRQREITTKELDFQMIKTKALNEFKGNIDLSFGIIGDNKRFDKIYDAPTQNPRVAVSFNVPIFDWGEKRARIKAQETAMRINELDAEEEKKDIVMNLRQTYRSLENQLRQIDIAEQSVQNAKQTYELNLERYRNGDLTGMEMSQFQTQLSNKQMSYIQTLINYKIELLNMKILSLYNFETNEPIVPLETEGMIIKQ